MDHQKRAKARCELFRAMTADPERVTALVRGLSSVDLRSRLSRTPMRPLDISFVEEEFRHNHCDRLVEATLRDSNLLLIHLVLDNQDTPDPETPQRLYAYTQRIWRWYRQECPDGPPLVGVAPLLIYTGEAEWNIPLEMPVQTDGNGANEPPDRT